MTRDLLATYPRTAHGDRAADLGLCLGTLPGGPGDEPGAGAACAGRHPGNGPVLASHHHRPSVAGIGNHIADYPLPETGSLMVIWVGMIASATVLVSSLSFALGTLLPRLTTLVKIVILMAWFLGSQIISILLGNASHAANFSLPAWYINWDPTSEGIALGLFNKYMTDFSNLAGKATSTAQTQHGLLTVENTLIDLGGWFAPHLLLAGLSLVLVLVAALAFKRSRPTLS